MTSHLIRRARLVPLAPDDRVPDDPVDVLVEDGTVTEVGPGLVRPAGVEESDAAGRWLAPGLWDQHVHLAQWTLAHQRLDLAGARSPEDATRMVAERVAAYPDLPVIGWGHRSGGWDRDVTVSELDAVSGDTAVVLISGDGHHAWLNTTALMHLAMPVRDSVVREAEWFAAYARLSTLVGNDGTSPQAYRRTLEDAAAMGIVGIVDFEFSGGAPEWAERWAAGCDLLRIRMATYADSLDDVIALGLRSGDTLPGCDGRATMGPLKIISDGSLNTRTAWCCDPYADAYRLEYPSGQANLSGDELRGLLARAHAHGLEVATHAIGDAAVAEALAAYAETGARGSIEHAQLVNRADVRRMAELGVRGSVQPAHLLDDRDLTEKIWPGRSRALLRVPLDARRRRPAGDGLGRAGLAARPVARDRGRGAPQRRRPAAPGTPSTRSRRRRRSPPRSTAPPPSASGRSATWCCSTATRWPASSPAGTPRRSARPCAPCRSRSPPSPARSSTRASERRRVGVRGPSGPASRRPAARRRRGGRPGRGRGRSGRR